MKRPVASAPRRGALVALALAATAAGAAPLLPLEDEAYRTLARLRGEGRSPPFAGALRELTEDEMQRLLREAGAAPDPGLLAPSVHGLWLRPAQRLSTRFALVDEGARGYSTAIAPRNIAGAVALSCEHQEGRPCGAGAGAALELDSSAGLGQWLSLFTRLRAGAGTGAAWGGVAVDRAALEATLGPVAVAAGRDALALSPSARTELMWSDHAAPADHARIGTARPLAAGPLRASVLWFVARLREPQRFSGTLVSGQRLELDFAERFALGGTRLLQLGGAGAPHVGLRELILEHFEREGDPASVGLSNNRLSLDASVSIGRARVYYQAAFEDLRRQFLDTLRYTTDHLLGLELLSRGRSPLRGLLVELQQTGINSQEHVLFTTGMTSAGRTVGSPLGPQAQSVYAQVALALAPREELAPWVEAVRFSSDVYDSPLEGHIAFVRRGPTEERLRCGLAVRFDDGAFSLEARAFLEGVRDRALAPEANGLNAGVQASLSVVPARLR